MTTGLPPCSSITYCSLRPGPKLIVLGAVHGNERCGTHAIEDIMQAIDGQELTIARGQVTFVPITNPLAYRNNTRNGERNLNRHFAATDNPQAFEDHVIGWLGPLLLDHDVLLDLHSFAAEGEPFALIGPDNNQGPLEPFAFARQEEALVRAIGVSQVLHGWLPTFAQGVLQRMRRMPEPGKAASPYYGFGTTEFMRQHGGYAVTVECGQHLDPNAVHYARAAIVNTLSHLQMLLQPVDLPRQEVASMVLYEVIDKIDDGDEFSRPWCNFDAVRAGEQIGLRASGTAVIAENDAVIMFPNPQARAGSEWFYLARPDGRLQRHSDSVGIT